MNIYIILKIVAAILKMAETWMANDISYSGTRPIIHQHLSSSWHDAAIGANDVQCGTQTPLSFSQPHLEGDGKVCDLHSDSIA
jgi:hypothetical protein